MSKKFQIVIIEPRGKTQSAEDDRKKKNTIVPSANLKARVRHAFDGMNERRLKVALRGTDHRLSDVRANIRISDPDSWPS